MKIVLSPRLSEKVIAMAQEALPRGFELVVARSDEEMAAALPTADFLMGTASKAFTPEVLAAMGNLKLVQLFSAGYDRVDLAAMRRLRLPVATNGGANAIGVAEHAVMLMLAVYRDLAALHERVKSGNWRRGAIGGQNFQELTGKTVGVVGLGMIEREVVKHLRGFDCRCLYYDLYRPPEAVERELGVSFAPLPELLARADVVTLHTPLTEKTHHLINRETLRLMKRSAILINAARGGLVDQEALYEALKEGVIAGYPVVDVAVDLFDGSFHEVDSSEMAFKIAGSMAFQEGFKKADPVILEPIMKVEVLTPEESMGDVMGDLTSKRGQILEMGDKGNVKFIHALVPLGSMFGYTTALRSMTQGRASNTMEFEKYAEVPPHVAQEIIEGKAK